MPPMIHPIANAFEEIPQLQRASPPRNGALQVVAGAITDMLPARYPFIEDFGHMLSWAWQTRHLVNLQQGFI